LNKASTNLHFVMTVDVDPPFSPKQNFVIEKGVRSLICLFEKYSIKATFFVPAIVARNFSIIMKEIIKQKHEIACHGLKHKPLEANLNFNKELQMIKKATEIIESITGLRPVGFRAPLFRINRNCWIALQKKGYFYDSSVVCSPLYGSYKMWFQSKPFPLNIPKLNRDYGLLEIPISVHPFLLYPFGGSWIRIFGLKWAKIGMKLNFIFQMPTVFYIHPKDVIKFYDRRWLIYLNTEKCLKMVEEIIRYARQNKAIFTTAYELAKLYVYKINK